MTVFTKYLDFANIFANEVAIELFKNRNSEKYIINLDINKKPRYKAI